MTYSIGSFIDSSSVVNDTNSTSGPEIIASNVLRSHIILIRYRRELEKFLLNNCVIKLKSQLQPRCRHRL